MKIIHNAHGATFALLGEQKIVKDTTYRPLSYIYDLDTDDGKLVYNFMTGELLFLTIEEYKSLHSSIDINNEVMQQLIKKWFVVPQDHNDPLLSRQIKQFLSQLVYNNTDAPMRIFTILPTTDCNARCFYCFELGRSRKDMSEKTAEDVADYIIRVSKGVETIRLRWFGGEPLYNSKAIDIICKKLKDAGVNFYSNFVSNGYLFNEENVKKGKELWNINDVQITLDGTEEIYNRCKAFIYRDGRSAFKVVTDNIERLLKANVGVKIRMNMDAHNKEDLYKLTDYLDNRFRGYKKFFYYVHLLFEDSGKVQMERNEFERHQMIQDFFDFEDYLRNKQEFYPTKTVKHLMQYHQCMADDPTTTIISPDGELGRCEHYSDTDFWGSIYNNQINHEVVKDFRRTKYLGKACDECVMYPMCMQLIRCAQTIPDRCDAMDKRVFFRHINRCIFNTYAIYKNSKHDNTNDIDDSLLEDQC